VKIVHLLNTYHDEPEENNSEIIKYMVYQCKSCLTVYDKAYGDIVNGIAANTEFETLSHYSCPVCEATKENFLPVEKMIATS
jgi:rubredoxin